MEATIKGLEGDKERLTGELNRVLFDIDSLRIQLHTTQTTLGNKM